MAQRYTYLPEHPREQDCCDTYALYQIKDVIKTDYFCCAYERPRGESGPPITAVCIVATSALEPRWRIFAKSTHGAPARRRHPPRSLRQRYSAGQSKWQAGRLLCEAEKFQELPDSFAAQLPQQNKPEKNKHKHEFER